MKYDVRALQNRLIEKAKKIYRGHPLSPEVIDAFYSVPRHQFISRFKTKEKGWVDVTEEKLPEYLELFYEDRPLLIFGDDTYFKDRAVSAPVSTISQPSFVLRMIDLLHLKKGMKVFEVGTGSGWNAALMGYLVGSDGKIISAEIIPDLVDSARKSLEKTGMKNVRVLGIDAGEGAQMEAPFDRIVFTAGASDLPLAFYSQIKPEGLLLFVLQGVDPSDLLLVLRKKQDHFVLENMMYCGFVPLTGRYYGASAQTLRDFPDMPPLEELKLRIYPSEVDVPRAPRQWILKRKDSQFIWST